MKENLKMICIMEMENYLFMEKKYIIKVLGEMAKKKVFLAYMMKRMYL